MNSHEFIRKANAAALRNPRSSDSLRVNESFIGALLFPRGRPGDDFDAYAADRLLYDMRIGVAPPTPTE